MKSFIYIKFLKKYCVEIQVGFFVLALSNCATTEIDMMHPEKAYHSIKTRYYDDGSYPLAVEKFKEFRSKYPYHKLSVQAELLLADSYFKQEKWIEASISYNEFVKLHPRHMDVAMALYRDAMCYYHQRNTTIGRDQQPTKDAIQAFDRYLALFPQGAHLEEVREKRADSVLQLAQSSQFVADFYYRKHNYHSALRRYLSIVDRFPKLPSIREKGYFRAALCYQNLIAAKKIQPNSDKNIYVARYTEKQLKKEASRVLEKYLKQYPTGRYLQQMTTLLSSLR